MPRKNREWYPDTMMHITSRGNNKEKIFFDDHDYATYIFYIKEALKYFEYKYDILAYTLMPNHIHIQIQTQDISISEFMKRLNWFYTRHYKGKYSFQGHLFEKRFYSAIIDNDSYALQVSRYIHLNPVKASMVNKPDSYKWSSFKDYSGQRKSSFIKTDNILNYFNRPNPKTAYKEFVNEGLKYSIEELRSKAGFQ